MSTIEAVAPAARRPPALLARPELAVPAVAAAAWAALAAHELWPLHEHRAGPASPASLGVVAEAVTAGVVMAVAMMLPVAFPAVRHVSQSSLRWRRPRAVAEFAGAYTALWAAFGAAEHLLVAPVGRSAAATAGALLVAAAWQLTPWKQHFVRRGHRALPLPPTGARATAAALRFGRVHGAACVGSCWGLMLVAAIVPSHQVPWAAALTGVSLWERRNRRPRRAARQAAVVLAAAAGLLLVTS